MVFSALEEALVSIPPFFSSGNIIYSTVVKEARRKIIFGSGEEEGRRRGEVVEKSEVYENIFPKTKMRQEMRRGAVGGAWRPSLPRGFLPPPSSKDQFLD